jgi:hypothetical protein
MSKNIADGQHFRGSKTNLFKICFEQVRILPMYQGQWITKGRWLEIVHERCKKTYGSIELTMVNTKIYSKDDLNPMMVNDFNLYKARHGGQFAFCSTLPGTLPPKPGARDGWEQLFVNKGESAHGRITRTNDLDVALVSPEDAARSATSRAKRKTKSGMTARNTRSKSKAASINIDETANQLDGVTLGQYEVTFWDSGTASKIFGLNKPTVAEENEDVAEVVKKRLQRYRLAHQTSGGWRQMIDDLDCKNLYTEYDVFQLRWRCRYVASALDIALKKLKPGYTWEDCCQEAIDTICIEEGPYFKCCVSRTVMAWHKLFKVNGECFINRYFHEGGNGYARVLPPLLQNYPGAKKMMVGYMKANLNDLSSEMLSSYIHEKVLPPLVIQREKELRANLELHPGQKFTVEDLLKENGLSKLAIPTVYRWIRKHRNGAPIEGSGLFELMSSQPDFVNEITLLQYFTEQRSLPAGCQLTLIRSPKCHPELAGEGIEYDWAAAKQFYRRQKLKDKRTKDKFRKLVIQSLDQVKSNLRIEFSRRARQYMLAYQTVESFKKDPDAAGKNFETSAHLLDSVVKERKSHRTVSQDGSWVGKMLKRMKEEPVHGDGEG